MPPSSVVARSLALAALGIAAISAAVQGQNVTAFNPYSGVGLPGGPIPQYGPQAAYPIVDTVGPGAGPAFNPWRPANPAPAGQVYAGPAMGVSAMGVSAMGGPARGGPVIVTPDNMQTYVPPPSYRPGSSLPPPPPGPIESRIVAIPEAGTARGAPRELHPPVSSHVPSHVPPAPRPVPLPPVAVAPPPAAAAAPPPPVTAAVAPPRPAPVATPAPPPPPPPVATPAPPQPAATPAPPPAAAPTTTRPAIATTPALTVEPATPARGAVVATVPFAGQSAELSDGAKADLDRVAKNIVDRSLRQVELRAYGGGSDMESRKVSLARALIVRSYLIDKGVKSRIEIGSFSGDGASRVDILAPNS